MVFSDLLKLMVHKKASDLFITAGVAPSIKVDGKVMPVTKQALTPEQSRAFVYGVMNEEQRRQFEKSNECNFSISPHEIGRFRVNIFMQQGRVGMVLRTIETKIPKFDELCLPKVLADIAVHAGEQLVEEFDDSDLGPQPPPDRTQLQPDHPAADDDKVPRYARKLQRTGGIDHDRLGVIDFDTGERGDRGAGGDDNVLGGHGLACNFDRVHVLERGIAL